MNYFQELFPQLLLLPPESAETKVIQCCIDIIKSQVSGFLVCTKSAEIAVISVLC